METSATGSRTRNACFGSNADVHFTACTFFVDNVQEAARELAELRQRLGQENLTVMAYRFEGGSFCTAQRFAACSEALGACFVARVLPDSAANRDSLAAFFEHVVAPHIAWSPRIWWMRRANRRSLPAMRFWRSSQTGSPPSASSEDGRRTDNSIDGRNIFRRMDRFTDPFNL
jgi:hypothetical protein